MSFVRLLSILSLVALPASIAACPGGDPVDPAQEASLVVGVQSDDFGGLVDRVHIVATVNGQLAADETVSVGPSNPAGLPKEILLRGAAGARVEVVVDATSSQAATRGGDPNVPLVARRAYSHLVPDAKKLLRMQLDGRCMTLSVPGNSAPPAPVCPAPTTCNAGTCSSAEVGFDQLEDYEPTWPTSPPDFCRPVQHGPPELFIGTGQTDYAPLAEEQVLQLERGPQGGHHIWIAARMKNLRQSGSRTSLTAKLVDDPASAILPAAYVFTFDRDEGNYCKLYGLRYQLDTGAKDLSADYKRFLGKRLEVSVEVVDSTKARAVATRTIRIADKLLCPDGTTSC